MKVYFSSTVKAKKQLARNFSQIYKIIEDLGHKNVSDFVLQVDEKTFYKRPSGIADKHYHQMIKEIKSADTVIFEVSVASLGIGYLVNLVLEMGKPVVLLHTKEHPPYLFQFLKSDKLQIYEYSTDNLKKVLYLALEEARQASNVRFTFFVTPKILQFFDYIAKKKKIPRAVYLRKIIDDAMAQEKFKAKAPF